MRVLGIDPGTLYLGYGLVQEDPEGAVTAIACGVLTGKRTHSIGQRLHLLYGELIGLMERYAPEEVAVEQPFFSVNARTAMAIGQAQGLALMAAAARDIPVATYSPLKVKQAVSGYGGASKEQVLQAVALHLGIDAAVTPEDAADALAVALCHLQARRADALAARSKE